VDFTHDVTNQLDVLTDALEDPGTDLPAVLAVLVDDLSAAIQSLQYLDLTIVVAGDPVTLSTGFSDPLPAVASLHLLLDELITAGAGGSVTFYAGRPGAFLDLAADIRHIYGHGRVVIDAHLHPCAAAPGYSGVTGLAEFSLINQAIGILIGEGQSRKPPGRNSSGAPSVPATP
jgi:hypothetical protein